MIAGNLGTRLFSVSMGGFDTHANQKDNQDRLLGQLGDALDAFMQDLANMKQQDDVTIMTFSEFGRRAKQNGSNGTDHGTAEPMFIIGNEVQGGLYGTYPSLGDLDGNGDLKFNADFRSVYAGMLKDVVGADPAPILAGSLRPRSRHARVRLARARRGAAVLLALATVLECDRRRRSGRRRRSTSSMRREPQARWGYAPRDAQTLRPERG